MGLQASTDSQPSQLASSPGIISFDGIKLQLSPQVTGSGLLKRFSIWGSASASPTVVDPDPEPEGRQTAQELLPIAPQITGSLWGSWWSMSPREARKSIIAGQVVRNGMSTEFATAKSRTHGSQNISSGGPWTRPSALFYPYRSIPSISQTWKFPKRTRSLWIGQRMSLKTFPVSNYLLVSAQGFSLPGPSQDRIVSYCFNQRQCW